MNQRISINPFFNENHDLGELESTPIPSYPLQKNADYSMDFFSLNPVLNRFHLINIITKCNQHIFHSYSLECCYLHQPHMKDIFDHCVVSLPL